MCKLLLGILFTFINAYFPSSINDDSLYERAKNLLAGFPQTIDEQTIISKLEQEKSCLSDHVNSMGYGAIAYYLAGDYQFNLFHGDSENCEKNRETALLLYVYAANEFLKTRKYELSMALCGIGVITKDWDREKEKAGKFIRLAADLGNKSALRSLGELEEPESDEAESGDDEA